MKCLKAKNLFDSFKDAFGIKDSGEVIHEDDIQCNIFRANKSDAGCNKIISDFENHVKFKHNEDDCKYCNIIFRSEQHLMNNQHECLDIGVKKGPAFNVIQKLINKGMKIHKKTCQDLSKDIDCPGCGQKLDGTNAVRRHINKDHRLKPLKSKQVCYNCTGGGDTAKRDQAPFVIPTKVYS